MSETREVMVALERFEKSYGKARGVHPLDLEIARGETFALLGPNGGGKTTILRALVGLHAPSGGRVLVGGHDIVRAPEQAKRLFSYVPQRVGLPELLTAREVLEGFATIKGVPRERVGASLERFALADDADRYVREFSGGMLQRLGLAVAFLAEVPLYVLDEPTLNLDPQGLRLLRATLRELKARGATVVFASHILQNAIELADRAAILAEGRLVRIDGMAAFESVVTASAAVRIVLRSTSEGILDAALRAGARDTRCNGTQLSFRAEPGRRLEIIRAIEGAGGRITEFHTESPDWGSLIHEHLGIDGDAS